MGNRYRHGEPIVTDFVEPAINQVISKRFVKRQTRGLAIGNAHRLLQVRTAVLNGDLRSTSMPGALCCLNEPKCKRALQVSILTCDLWSIPVMG